MFIIIISICTDFELKILNEFKGAASKKSKFREAMVEAFTNPLKFFQFNSDENDKIEKWLDGQDDVESNDTAWTLLGNKIIVLYIHF